MIVERNPIPMILVIACTILAGGLLVFFLNRNNETSEVPEHAAAVAAPAPVAAQGDLNPAADPTE